jgi:tetratricopeptide (TPR) repeat protein
MFTSTEIGRGCDLRDIKAAVIAALAAILLTCSAAMGQPDPRLSITSAKALKSMARIYMAGGRYDMARHYADKAVSAARSANEPDTLLSGCLVDLAWADMQLGNYASAWENGQKGLAIQQAAYGSDHIYTAYTMRILASICRERGDYKKAQSILNESLEVMKANSAGANELAPFLVDRADILVASGKFAEAEQAYADARARVVTAFGQSHLYSATVTAHAAALYTKLEKFDEAEQLLNEAYPTLTEVFGDDSYALVDAWMTRAAIYEHNGRTLDAENTIKRALARTETQYGTTHPQAARILAALGTFYIDHGNYAEASKICPMALERLEKSLGESHDATAMAMNDMARIYAKQGRMGEASRLCTNAATALAQVFGPEHPSMARVRHTLSSLLVAMAPSEMALMN